MRWVISDSSTLIHLEKKGRLGLLQKLYRRIIIPPAVWSEVVEQGGSRAGAVEVADAKQHGWIKVVVPGDQDLARLLKRDLDDGEAEAIALSVERKTALVLLDELEARRIADIYGLPKTGVIGILIKAKREGQIGSLQEERRKLQDMGGFWVGDQMTQQALNAVGESEVS